MLTGASGWRGLVCPEAERVRRARRAKLAKDEETSAQKMVVRLISTAKQANNQVLDYEFRYCRLQPSKFL